MRFGIVIAALLGFAVYFFYDGHIGYARQNEAIFSYKAFATMGHRTAQYTPLSWHTELSARGLIPTIQQHGTIYAAGDQDTLYPLPNDCPVVNHCPPEILDYHAMSRSWSDCWAAYSERMHYPIKPGDHPHDIAAIREQWIAGAAFSLIGFLLVGFAWRTYRRELSLRGNTITAAGQHFDISDVSCIDLRQWGPGFKGIAYFTVRGKRIRFDGMTYGGFNKDKGEPAEALMQAILAQYKGDIIEYEEPTEQNA